MLGTRQIYNRTKCDVDVIFVLDESSSVNSENFEKSKSFLSALVGRLNVDSRHTRVGLVTFSTNVDPKEAFNLNAHFSVASVQSAISSLDYSMGITHTAAALRYVRQKMLTPAAGDRAEVPNVVFVMTDGKSNKEPHQTKVCTRAGTAHLKPKFWDF